jgi:hypothetical protein
VSSLFPVQSGTLGTATISIVPSAVLSASITTVVGTGGASAQSAGTPTYVVVGQQATAAVASANLCAGT